MIRLFDLKYIFIIHLTDKIQFFFVVVSYEYKYIHKFFYEIEYSFIFF